MTKIRNTWPVFQHTGTGLAVWPAVSFDPSIFAGGTDPRQYSGPGLVGPGGPRDRDAVLIPAASAVLLDRTSICEMGAQTRETGDRLKVFAMTLGGRINHSSSQVDLTFLFGSDGAAALVAEVFALACRSGIREEFLTDLRQRLTELDVDGNLDDMTGL